MEAGAGVPEESFWWALPGARLRTPAYDHDIRQLYPSRPGGGS